jgi:hypothetical protein
VKWIDYSLLDKNGNPGRPIIPISIGCYVFPEAICDFGASVNIMPKVIYEKILSNPLLYTNMRLQLADQSIYSLREYWKKLLFVWGNHMSQWILW